MTEEEIDRELYEIDREITQAAARNAGVGPAEREDRMRAGVRIYHRIRRVRSALDETAGAGSLRVRNAELVRRLLRELFELSDEEIAGRVNRADG